MLNYYEYASGEAEHLCYNLITMLGRKVKSVQTK